LKYELSNRGAKVRDSDYLKPIYTKFLCSPPLNKSLKTGEGSMGRSVVLTAFWQVHSLCSKFVTHGNCSVTEI
jgi:hypothetical protein